MPQGQFFVVSVLLSLAAASFVQGASNAVSQAGGPPTTSEVELLVKQALEDRLAAKNLPDANLLGSGTRIPVREEMPRAGIKLGPGALPERTGTTFYLLSEAAAQAEADKTAKSIFFVTADQPTISQDLSTVWLGVDAVAPRDPKVIMSCCCRGLGQFRRMENRWTFVKWIQMICS